MTTANAYLLTFPNASRMNNFVTIVSIAETNFTMTKSLIILLIINVCFVIRAIGPGGVDVVRVHQGVGVTKNNVVFWMKVSITALLGRRLPKLGRKGLPKRVNRLSLLLCLWGCRCNATKIHIEQIDFEIVNFLKMS
mmetsp:Transcript_18972/g.25306  ORF Transcript_18972/g.25306 Transcript_18972/m.25306 type:complete len:137 (+) Transcript_18972:206-616(+)